MKLTEHSRASVALEIHNFTKNKLDDAFLKKIANIALEVVGKEKPNLNLRKKNLEISLAVVGDNRMRKLNKMYRGHNRVTDVLSFGNKAVVSYLNKGSLRAGKSSFIEAPDGIDRLGEVIICYSRAKKQARQNKHSLANELTVLLVHGILHLLDYDHEKEEKDRLEMEGMQDKILQLVASL